MTKNEVREKINNMNGGMKAFADGTNTVIIIASLHKDKYHVDVFLGENPISRHNNVNLDEAMNIMEDNNFYFDRHTEVLNEGF